MCSAAAGAALMLLRCCHICACEHLQELQFDAAKGPALTQMDKTCAQTMHRAANAMVVLAADPAALPQHPSVDLSAAATAAIQAAAGRLNNAGASSTSSSGNGSSAAARGVGSSSSSSGAGSSRHAVGHMDMLPPLDSLSDDLVLQMLRGTAVSGLKRWLEAEGE